MLGYTVNLEPAFDRTLSQKGGARKKGQDHGEAVREYYPKVTGSQMTDASHPSVEAQPSLGMPGDMDRAPGSLHSTRTERWTDDCGS